MKAHKNILSLALAFGFFFCELPRELLGNNIKLKPAVAQSIGTDYGLYPTGVDYSQEAEELTGNWRLTLRWPHVLTSSSSSNQTNSSMLNGTFAVTIPDKKKVLTEGGRFFGDALTAAGTKMADLVIDMLPEGHIRSRINRYRQDNDYRASSADQKEMQGRVVIHVIVPDAEVTFETKYTISDIDDLGASLAQNEIIETVNSFELGQLLTSVFNNSRFELVDYQPIKQQTPN